MDKKYRGVTEMNSGKFAVYYKGMNRGTYSDKYLAAKIYNVHVLQDNKDIGKVNFHMTPKQVKDTWNFYREHRGIKKEPEIKRKMINGVEYRKVSGYWCFIIKLYSGTIKKLGRFNSLEKAEEGFREFQSNNQHILKGC